MSTSSFRLLRDRRFGAFFAAEAVSAIGSWASLIAIWGYAAYEFDASAADVARFGIAFSLPGIVLGPLSGTLIDRYGPKAMLGASKVIGIVASLALLTADDFTSLALLSAVHGAAYTFAIPSLQAMPPRLVADEDLASTNALVSLTDEFAIVAGPVVAAVAIEVFGFRGAFIVDALTFALGLVVLPFVRLRPLAPSESDEVARVRDVLVGIRLVARRPVLRRTVGVVASVHLLYGVALLSEPLYVRDVLERSTAVFAALQSVFGVALVIGGILVARAGERIAGFTWVAGGAIGSAITAVAYLATPWITVAFVGVAAWGLVTASISGPSRTVLQRATPEAMHGRVLSTDFVAGSTAELLGVATAGFVVSALDVPRAVVLFASVVLVVAVAALAGDARDPETAGGLPVAATT